MSANEKASAKLTDRQLAEQKEAQKVRIYTIAFVAALVVMVVIAAVVGVTRTIEASGIHEKNTVAATVGGHEISNAELSYFFMDAVNNFNSNYGSYAFLYGIDPSKPLNQQVMDETTGETWADSFVEQAIASAQAVYALSDAAKAEGFTLSAEQQMQVDVTVANLDAYATMYGYSNADDFIKAQYGNGTSKKGYTEYYERNILASAYQAAHQDSLTYTNEALRAADAENPSAYSSFSYNQYYLSVNKFLTGGTANEDGTTTYSDAERAAADAAALAAATALTDESITSVEELDAAIAGLEVNEGVGSSTAYNAQRLDSMNSYLTDWVSDASRVAGDKTFIPVTSTTTDEAGNEVETITAYYVVFFREVVTNETNLVNVRHILVSFTGETNEDGTYTDEAKAVAKASAEELLAQWKSGDATEESFAALATEKTTDSGSVSTGGLYENVYPGQMVVAFNDWCFDADRTAGDTGIVETEYGYHVMYFVSQADMTYRDFMITNALKNQDMQDWYTSIVDAYTVTEGNTQYIRKDVVMSR